MTRYGNKREEHHKQTRRWQDLNTKPKATRAITAVGKLLSWVLLVDPAIFEDLTERTTQYAT
jgi:hypothetical protein